LPPTCFNMSKEGRNFFYEALENVKFLDGMHLIYISNYIQKYKTLSVLKFHDYHVLIQHLLPIALRGNSYNKVTLID